MMSKEVFDPEDDLFRVTYKEQPRFYEILGEWARQLPLPGVILDPFAGYGSEVRYLRTRGFRVIAMEQLKCMRDKAVADVLAGDLKTAKFNPGSLAGILVKDTWMFLTEAERADFLKRSHLLLAPGGSVLLVSIKNSVYRALIKDGELDFTITTADTNGDVSRWEKEVGKETARGSKVVAIEYPCMSSQLASLAESHGYDFDCLVEYNSTHPLAEENRWQQRSPGFIVKLTVRK